MLRVKTDSVTGQRLFVEVHFSLTLDFTPLSISTEYSVDGLLDMGATNPMLILLLLRSLCAALDRRYSSSVSSSSSISAFIRDRAPFLPLMCPDTVEIDNPLKAAISFRSGFFFFLKPLYTPIEDKVVLSFTYEAWNQLGVYFEYRIK